jgi:hypothetical protein
MLSNGGGGRRGGNKGEKSVFSNSITSLDNSKTNDIAAVNWILQLEYASNQTDIMFTAKSFEEVFSLCRLIEEAAKASGMQDDDPIITTALITTVVSNGWDPDAFNDTLTRFVRSTEAQVRALKSKTDN